MAEKSLSLDELVRKLMGDEHADILRETLAWFVGELMEAEVAGQIGAGRHEKSAGRTTHRNGYRERLWQTRAGEIELAIPRLRTGSYFPSFLEPRSRSEQALVAVVQEAPPRRNGTQSERRRRAGRKALPAAISSLTQISS
jgi:transposase-like protein